jgi:hypothetical protein
MLQVKDKGTGSLMVLALKQTFYYQSPACDRVEKPNNE